MTCMGYKIITLGIEGLSIPVPSHQQQPAQQQPLQITVDNVPHACLLNPTISVGLNFEILLPSPSSSFIV